MIKIDKNIPVGPARVKHAAAHAVFEQMEPGDSFALFARDEVEAHKAKVNYSAFASYCKKHDWTYSSRTSDGVMRVWRLT
jgi:hypothetical protein